MTGSATTAPTVDAWDPSVILASPSAVEAVRSLGEAVRSSGYRNSHNVTKGPDALIALATGSEVGDEIAAEWLGGVGNVDALVAAGGADQSGEGAIALRFAVLAGAGAVAVLPKPDLLEDGVYSGPDSWVLVEKAWRFGLGGDRAVDLGTGTGLAATFLTSRYDQVVATDVLAAAVDTAALSRELLAPEGRGRLVVSRTDVADGLAPGPFDLVMATTPWVPSPIASGQTFADGGPTGFELPLRFLLGGVDLLSDRGVLVMLCTDLRFTDGRAPLWDALSELEDRGFAHEVEVTPRSSTLDFVARDAPDYMGGLEAASHVTVVVYRPEPSGQ